MRKLIIATLVILIFLWATITVQASSSLVLTSFRTNLMKGIYADDEPVAR